MAPAWRSAQDFVKWALFELGAGFYARKLASGPEAELRREFAEFLLASCPAAGPSSLNLLDVGCGPGHLTRYLGLRGCKVTAVDRSARLLRIARRLAAREGVEVQFKQASADSLPFPDASFECTCATTVIYFVANPVQTLTEMVRVTRTGGIVAILDPHASLSVSAMRAYSERHQLPARDRRKLTGWALAAQLNRRFSESELMDLFRRTGLRDIVLERRMDGMVWFARGTVERRQ